MQETQVQSLGGDGPLEKGMATLSSTLAWRIPRTEEPAVYGVTKSHARLTGFFTLWVGALKDAEMTR